jgi:hypothetical protein
MSISKVRRPLRANNALIITAEVVLPVPPFWIAKLTIVIGQIPRLDSFSQ